MSNKRINYTLGDYPVTGAVADLETRYYELKKRYDETIEFLNSIGEKDPRSTQFLIKRIRYYLTGREEVGHPEFPIPCNDPECCDIESLKAIIIEREKERIRIKNEY